MSAAARAAAGDPYAEPFDDPCEERREVGERLPRPAAPVRPAARGWDVFLTGTVFIDMIFTGLAGPPPAGTEAWARGLGSAPGGIANLAVAMSRLGLRVRLAAAFGDDMFGAYVWRTLAEQEQIDLSLSRRVRHWPTPVTVSLPYERDRGMVTYGEPLPLPGGAFDIETPSARTCFVHLDPRPPAFVAAMRRAGSKVFADLGWDPTGAWSPEVLDALADVDVFVPNSVEAMAYTRTRTPEDALSALGERVRLVVVKCGADGAIACDVRTGERVREPALPVEPLDPTGAGDVFGAAFLFATLAEWPLAERVRFANLAAGLSVRHHSGSLGAPCWHEVSEWFAHSGMGPRSRFLAPYLPESAVADRARARPTVEYVRDDRPHKLSGAPKARDR